MNRFQRRAVPKFEGSEPSLKGFIYDIGHEKTADQYIKTTRAIVGWVGRTFDNNTTAFTDSLTTLQLVAPNPGLDPNVNQNAANQHQIAAEVLLEIWKRDYALAHKKRQEYTDFRSKLYHLLLGQCTEALRNRLESHQDYNTAANDGLLLLAIIKALCYTFEERSKVEDAMCGLKEQFYAMKQQRFEALQAYHDRFKALVEVLDEVDITYADAGLIEAVAASHQRAGAPNNADRAEAKGRALAIRFIRGAHEVNRSYLVELRNNFLHGHDDYPTSLHAAYNILQRWQVPTQRRLPGGDGVAFATTGEEDTQENQSANNANTGGDRRQCWRCGEIGHISTNCPNRPTDQEGNLILTQGFETVSSMGFSFSQGEDGKTRSNIPKNWILLDNQSTINLFCNRDMLVNVRESTNSMTVRCNAGSRVTNLVGELPGFGTVWFDPEAIANILSLKLVQEKYHVSYDSDEGNRFIVTKPNGQTFTFTQSETGLYYLDASSDGDNALEFNNDDEDVLLVNTVADNTSSYTVNQYSRAVEARNLQIKIGRPTTRQFIRIVEQRMLPNCPVTKYDILIAEDIFGPDIGSLQGKTTRRRPHRVQQQNTSSILPDPVFQQHRSVTVCMDVMYVNGQAMLVTISRGIKFGTVEGLTNRSIRTLIRAINNVRKLYVTNGFRVVEVLADGEFAHLKDGLAEMGITFNGTAADEHVGDIERYIRTVKERMRSCYAELPFAKIPRRMVIELAKYCVFWLNAFPSQSGISDTISPRTIITRQEVDFNHHCRYEFGQYLHTHEKHRNDMQPRTVGALALRPIGNRQGGWVCFSLSSWKLIKRYQATPLPMPDDVIRQVEEIAEQQEMDPGLAFTDRLGNPAFGDEEDEETDPSAQFDEQNQRDEDVTIDGDGDVGSTGDADVDMIQSDDEDVDTSGDELDSFDYDPADYESGEEGSNHDDNHDEENDPDYTPTDDEHDDEEEDDVLSWDTWSSDIGDDLDYLNNNVTTNEDVGAAAQAMEEAPSVAAVPLQNTGVTDPPSLNVPDVETVEENTGVVPDQVENTGVDPNQETLDAEMDRAYGPRSGRYGLRRRRRRREPTDYGELLLSYGRLLVGSLLLNQDQSDSSGKGAAGGSLATPQYPMKEGLKIFGVKGDDAVRKELKQLHDRIVMAPKHAYKDMTKAQRKEALGYLMFLKRKRCGKIKGRGCADGRP